MRQLCCGFVSLVFLLSSGGDRSNVFFNVAAAHWRVVLQSTFFLELQFPHNINMYTKVAGAQSKSWIFVSNKSRGRPHQRHGNQPPFDNNGPWNPWLWKAVPVVLDGATEAMVTKALLETMLKSWLFSVCSKVLFRHPSDSSHAGGTTSSLQQYAKAVTATSVPSLKWPGSGGCGATS